jgi:hypothetical protein
MWPLIEHFTPQLAVAALLASSVHAIAHGDEYTLGSTQPELLHTVEDCLRHLRACLLFAVRIGQLLTQKTKKMGPSTAVEVKRLPGADLGHADALLFSPECKLMIHTAQGDGTI